MDKMSEEIIRMEGISKEFPGVKALSDVSFILKRGEVHGLVGENGAGKSTLIKILMGIYPKDKGEIFIEGEKVEITNPIQSREYGLRAVYQDITLAPHLSVEENFFLGRLPTKRLIIDWATVNRVTSDTLKELDLDIDPRKKLKELTLAQREMVTIAKIIHEKARVIIFDEPTALLGEEEVKQLFEIIYKLKSEGTSVIYISHRLEEIFSICDTVTVLRDGKLIGTFPLADVDEGRLVSVMVGRDLKDIYSIKHQKSQEIVLEVKNLTKEPKFRGINLQLHKGEILGMFGLVGSGRTDVVRCLFGADKYDTGEIIINGEKKEIRSPIDGINAGIGLLPEDRKMQGLALPLSIMANINMVVYDQISTLGVMNRKEERKRTEKYLSELKIKTPSMLQKVEKLSGGNQQKVVISKWLNAQSNIFIFDEATFGVDVGAKLEIYRIFEKLISSGASIIWVSSYLPELMGLADRILVMHEGRCAAIVNNGEATEEDILKLASGLSIATKTGN